MGISNVLRTPPEQSILDLFYITIYLAFEGGVSHVLLIKYTGPMRTKDEYGSTVPRVVGAAGTRHSRVEGGKYS